jgi:hypothetical protein
MTQHIHFIQDRTALLLVSANFFLLLALTVLVGLKMNAIKGTASYIISYRSSLGIAGYTQGTAADILSFIGAGVLFFGLGLALGVATYKIKRQLSLTILGVTIPLLLLLIIVSNALLALR